MFISQGGEFHTGILAYLYTGKTSLPVREHGYFMPQKYDFVGINFQERPKNYQIK